MQTVVNLQQIPLFACLDAQALDRLSAAGTVRAYPPNAVLFNEGDPTDSLYVILNGKVKAMVFDDHGKEMILSIFGTGDYFGELAFVDGKERSASIVTKTKTKVFIISRNEFKQLMATHADLTMGLLRGAVQRLRETTRTIEGLALMDVYGRVARLMGQLAESQGEVQVIPERLTHKEIANMIGASREMVSRIFKELVDGGYVSVDKTSMTLHKALPYAW